MPSGYGLPTLFLVAATLSAVQDLARSRPAALRRMPQDRRDRHGRSVMNPSRMVVAWVLTVMVAACALYNASVGAPGWWLWLVAVAVQLTNVAIRLYSRAQFQAFTAAASHPTPAAP